MTTISINIRDLLNNTTVNTVSFTLVNDLTSEGSILKIGDTRTATLTAGIGSIQLSVGDYVVRAGNKKWLIGVTGTGSANLIDLIDITTPTPIQKGLPVGGTTGQILAKQSNTDFDTEWVGNLNSTWGAITGTLSSQTDLQNALNAKQNTIVNSDSITQGASNLFLTTTERSKLNNTSGTNTGDQDLFGLLVKTNNLSDLTNTTTARNNLGLGSLATQNGTFSGTSSGINTGDQTSIVGITGTIAQFNTALTGDDFATLGGVETLANKTLTDPVINIASTTTKQLLSIIQTNLASNYTATAGSGEEEVTGLKVTLPIINTVCTIKITHKVYVATAPMDNSYRVRFGTSSTFTSNTLVDNLYVSGAKTLETMSGFVLVTANLGTQNYINYSFLNNTNRNGCSISASGARSTILVEIYA